VNIDPLLLGGETLGAGMQVGKPALLLDRW
jgi:hypothetical protein